MAINQNRYVDITSGVGGVSAASRRELIGRILTTNQLAPTGQVLEFSELSQVGAHFGTESNEYAMAAKYFSYISEDIVSPDKISYARYSTSALPAQLISTAAIPVLSSFTQVTNGGMTLSFGGKSFPLTGLDFSSATSLSAVAGVVEAAIGAAGANAQFSGGRFVLSTTETGNVEIEAASAPDSPYTDVSTLFGWDAASMPIISNGASASTLASELDRIDNLNNNFGSFAIVESAGLSDDQIKEVAAWVDAGNVKYMWSVPVTQATAQGVANLVNGKNGVALTLSSGDDYAEIAPMAIMAATDYSRRNAATNYMYKQFDAEATVTTDAQADVYDTMLVNYIGATQQAGRLIAFYQRGFLQGEIADMGVYANEIWLKDAIITECLNRFISLKKIPANSSGKVTMTLAVQGVIEEALANGTILSEKTLTNNQIAYITQVSGDSDAWMQVQNSGYWFDAQIKQRQNSAGITEYYFDYILIYSKGDSVRKVEGSDILI